ncbi:MAG: hypothetical protein AB8B49_09660 [Nitratireductor sp.]
MNLKSISFQLKFASSIIIAFGAMCLLAIFVKTQYPLILTADIIFWPPGNPSDVMISKEAILLSTILGGVMIAWGMMFWMITEKLLPKDPALAKSLMLNSALIWFVFDSLGSLFGPAPMNALFNIGFLLPIIIPLLQIRNDRKFQ